MSNGKNRGFAQWGGYCKMYLSVYAVPYTLLALGAAHIQLRQDSQSFSHVRMTRVNTFKFISDLIMICHISYPVN